jgi:serine/threonine protein phosphatase PrpC
MRYRREPDPFPAPSAANPPRKLRVSAASRSDRGQQRADNQDRAVLADAASALAWEPPAALAAAVDPSGGFYALVCDGMGGEAGGAVASALAVETIIGAMRARWVQRSAEPATSVPIDESRVALSLVASLEAASARIQRAAREEPAYARMGTTATLAVIAHGVLLCAQIGDSRAYVLRAGRIVQVTEDQTMAEYLRKSGAVPPDQIASIVGPNVILQALGSTTRVEVAVTRTPLAQGDVVLVCSDGLFGCVGDREIAELVYGASDLAIACERLVARANEEGGPDNISCAAFYVRGDALPPADSPAVATSLTPPLLFR